MAQMWCCCIRQVRFHVKHWKFAPSIWPWTGLLLLWLNFSLEKSSHSNATTFNGSWEILPGTQFSRLAKNIKVARSKILIVFCGKFRNFCKFGQNISPGPYKFKSALQYKDDIFGLYFQLKWTMMKVECIAENNIKLCLFIGSTYYTTCTCTCHFVVKFVTSCLD